MVRNIAQSLLSLVGLTLLVTTGLSQEAKETPNAEIVKLVEHLKSRDFRVREKAVQELSKLQEVPDVLREAARSNDLEVRRRAQTVVDAIIARVEEKAFQGMIADLHKVELDRFIHRMITDEKVADDKQWDVIQTVAKAVTKRANQLGGKAYPVPDVGAKQLNKILLDHDTRNRVSIDHSLVLSTGRIPRVTSISNSIVIVDGDLGGATSIINSLVIVRGNIGRCTGVDHSILVATGNFVGATGCDESFLNVNNQRIRFTSSRHSILVKTQVKTTGLTSSTVLDTDKSPLQLLRFSARKTDAELSWSKEVNGLTMALALMDQKGKVLIRWKNAGKDLLEMPWTRFNSDFEPHADDLFGHVMLRGPDGKVAAAREYPAPRFPGRRFLGGGLVLGPGQVHEEIIDLWAYVQKPAAGGHFQLSIDLDIQAPRRMELDARAWTGSIRSNVLDIKLDK